MNKKVLLIIISLFSVSIIGIVSYVIYQHNKPLIASEIKASDKDCLSVKNNNVGSSLILNKCNKKDTKQQFIYNYYGDGTGGSFQLLDNKCFKVKNNNNLIVGECDGKNDKKLRQQTYISTVPGNSEQLFIVDNKIDKVDINDNIKCLHYDTKKNNVTVGDCIASKKVIDNLEKNNIDTNTHDKNLDKSKITLFTQINYNEFWVLNHIPELRNDLLTQIIGR